MAGIPYCPAVSQDTMDSTEQHLIQTYRLLNAESKQKVLLNLTHLISQNEPVQPFHAPLRQPLADGKTLAWEDRLEQCSNSYWDNGGPIIGSYTQAVALHDEFLRLSYTAPGSAEDFPESFLEQQKLVGEIYDAIREMEDVVDDEGSCKTRKVMQLSRMEIEILSWKVLYAVKEVHLGHLPFRKWRDNIKFHKFDSFRSRLAIVVRALQLSKAAVCSLLDPPFIGRLASDPQGELTRKRTNKVGANKRKEDMAQIRKRKMEVQPMTPPGGGNGEGNGGREGGGGGGVVPPPGSPEKKAKISRRPSRPRATGGGTNATTTGPRSIVKGPNNNYNAKEQPVEANLTSLLQPIAGLSSPVATPGKEEDWGQENEQGFSVFEDANSAALLFDIPFPDYSLVGYDGCPLSLPSAPPPLSRPLEETMSSLPA